MIIFKDILSGDEMFSDAFDIDDTFMDGAFYKIKCKKVAKGGTQLDGAAFGFNASEEAGDDEGGFDDAGVEQVWDVVDSHLLQSTMAHDKKSYPGWVRRFAKAVVAKLEEKGMTDQAAAFKKTAPAAVKYMKSIITDCDLFAGESQDLDGSLAYLNFEENGIDAYMLFFKGAIYEEKV